MTGNSIRLLCFLLVSGAGFRATAQVPAAIPSEPGGPEGPVQLLSPQQLDNLVTPVALYPDQLLSQVLAASTYPLELVEAQQWLQRNGTLQGVALMDAAKQQNWDPSVQAMVAFPDAMALLTRDVQWTTSLGNAFLAQQADVMNAIQYMRARAQSNGRLVNTPQQVVTTQVQDGQNAIEIQPANPQYMYVPSYNPHYIWGPPAVGYYPNMTYYYQPGYYPQTGYYPQDGYYPQTGYYAQDGSSSNSAGIWFGRAVNIATYLAGFTGLIGTGGWGWALNWFAHSLFLNGLFFNNFGFGGGGGGYSGGAYYGGYGARSAWVHDPGHRLGVPYPNHVVAVRYGGSYRGGGAGFVSHSGLALNGGAGWHSAGSIRSFGGASSFASRPGTESRGFSQNYNRGAAESYRGGIASNRGWKTPSGSSFLSSNRSVGAQSFAPSRGAERFSAPQASTQHFSAPKGSSSPRMSAPQHFSAPKSSGSHFSGGHSSGGRSTGGHNSGGHSHGGSGRR